MPILYVIAKLLWAIIPFYKLDETLTMVLNDLTGPLALMTVLYLSCVCIFWRIPGLNLLVHFLFGTKPNIHGTWQGKLSYIWEGKEYEKTVYLVIKQNNGYSMDIWLFTDERISSSTFAEVISYKSTQRLIYTYIVEDSPINKEKNPLHNGLCCLDFKNKYTGLEGMYYTSRKTMGVLQFTRRNTSIVESYEGAKRLFKC
jgi:hypothetical protein